MALNFSKGVEQLSVVRLICSIDDALDLEASNLEAYKESLDEKHLAFLPGKSPTVFVCNFKLDAKSMRLVNNSMLSAKGDDGKPSLAFGSWSQTIAKVALKDIQCPADQPVGDQLAMKKDASGYAHDDLLGTLEQFGVVDEIFNA